MARDEESLSYAAQAFGLPPVHTGPMPVRALQAIHVLFLGGGFVWLLSDGYNMTFMLDPVFNSGIPVCSAHSPSMVPSAAYFISVIFIGGGLVWLRPGGRNVTFRSIPTLNSALPLPFSTKDAPLAGLPLPHPRVHTVRSGNTTPGRPERARRCAQAAQASAAHAQRLYVSAVRTADGLSRCDFPQHAAPAHAPRACSLPARTWPHPLDPASRASLSPLGPYRSGGETDSKPAPLRPHAFMGPNRSVGDVRPSSPMGPHRSVVESGLAFPMDPHRSVGTRGGHVLRDGGTGCFWA